MDLVPLVYVLLKQLPQEEQYALGSQIRRASVSIAANIAEGQARESPKEFAHYLSIARGSLAELDTLLLVGERLSYWKISPELPDRMAEIRRILFALISKLKT